MNISQEESRLFGRLAEIVKDRQVTQMNIAEETEIHQSQISRILSGQALRYSPNVEKLCNYARSLIEVGRNTHSYDALDLNDALTRIWDGSPAHAKALKEVLRAIGDAQATFHQNK